MEYKQLYSQLTNKRRNLFYTEILNLKTIFAIIQFFKENQYVRNYKAEKRLTHFHAIILLFWQNMRKNKREIHTLHSEYYIPIHKDNPKLFFNKNWQNVDFPFICSLKISCNFQKTLSVIIITIINIIILCLLKKVNEETNSSYGQKERNSLQYQ